MNSGLMIVLYVNAQVYYYYHYYDSAKASLSVVISYNYCIVFLKFMTSMMMVEYVTLSYSARTKGNIKK